MTTHTARKARFFCAILLIVALLVVQQGGATATGNNAFASKPLSNGVEARLGGIVLQVVALRDDVIRVREAGKHDLPEDASWAVPSEVRKQSVQVTSEDSEETVGFRTGTLRVKIDRATLRLAISDLDGNLLQEDPEG